MSEQSKVSIDCGHGVTLTGHCDARTGIAEAIAAGNVFCMPRSHDGRPLDPERFEPCVCPHCRADCFRHKDIPAEARVACTACALRMGAGRSA